MYLHKIKLACLTLCTICATFLFFDTAFAATASISTTGTVSIDVSNSGNSANIGTDTLTVNTTCASGYTVSISSSQADTKLYKDGDATSTNYISPVSGTASILGENLGTWGYSLSSEINGNFIGLTNANAILTTKSTASAGSGDQIPVYYGVSVTPGIPTGTYTMSNNATISIDLHIIFIIFLILSIFPIYSLSFIVSLT